MGYLKCTCVVSWTLLTEMSVDVVYRYF